MSEAAPNSPRDATLDHYRQHVPAYRFDGTGTHHPHLVPFLDRLEPGASVLELGCGTGIDAARMMERGFAVDATDGTPAMVRKAKERFGLEARVMRFDQLDLIAQYDAVWAHACLLHVPLADLAPILSAIRRALRGGGLHFANFKLRDDENPDEGYDLLGRWTNLPDEDWLQTRYAAAGFRIVERERYAGRGSDGVPRDWCAMTVENPVGR